MKLRVARHTDNLIKLIEFYTQILGLKKLGEFQNHAGYAGAFIGKENTDWHLEFTSSNTSPEHYSDEDDLLVLYCSQSEYELILLNLKERNIPLLNPKNPYWEIDSLYIKDPDGFGIILTRDK